MISRKQPIEFRRHNPRRGALLFCVLVVLAIVALVTAQSLQSMTLLNRSDRGQLITQQARELLVLGKQALREGLEDGSIDADKLAKGLVWDLEITDGLQGRIRVQVLESVELETEGSAVQQFRLIATLSSQKNSDQAGNSTQTNSTPTIEASEIFEWKER